MYSESSRERCGLCSIYSHGSKILDLCEFSKRFLFTVKFYFRKTMSVSLHGLLEPSWGSFPRGDRSSIPRNREYHDTFITLSRGALLFPQTSLALLHNREYLIMVIPVPTSFSRRPSLKTRQALAVFTPRSTHCNEPGQRPVFNCQP